VSAELKNLPTDLVAALAQMERLSDAPQQDACAELLSRFAPGGVHHGLLRGAVARKRGRAPVRKYLDDALATLYLKALSAWNPSRGVPFTAFIATHGLRHADRAEVKKDHRDVTIDSARVARKAPGVVLGGEVYVSTSPSLDGQAAQAWRADEAGGAEEDDLARQVDDVMKMRHYLLAEVHRREPLAVWMVLVQAVNGVEVKQAAETLSVGGVLGDYFGDEGLDDVARETASRRLARARQVAVAVARENGLDLRLVRVALRVADEEQWERLVAGIEVEDAEVDL